MTSLSSSLTLDGCTLRYDVERGAEPGVLLLHGAGMDHTVFGDLHAALTGEGRLVVRLDLRGHGDSRPTTTSPSSERLVDDILALVDALGLTRPILLGHSLGGNVAQELVRRDPTRWSGLIVLDSTWNVGPVTWLERVALYLARPTVALVPAGWLPEMLANASSVKEDVRKEATRIFQRLDKAEFLAAWNAAAGFVNPCPGATTPVPLLLVRGAEDTTGNISTAMPAWAQADGVDEVVIPDAGHLVMCDAPEATRRAVLEFVKRITATE